MSASAQVTAKPVVDLAQALGLGRDGSGLASHVPAYRFLKIRFPAQRVYLSESKQEIQFRVPRQNNMEMGPAPGVFETDDESLAKELLALAQSKKDLHIVRAQN